MNVVAGWNETEFHAFGFFRDRKIYAAGEFANDPRTVLAIGAYLWDKNPANPNDNDGRVVVASIPEGPTLVFLFLALVLPLVARRARARARRSR